MRSINITQQGNIYFFYRPKVQHFEAHEMQDIQKFFAVLKPESASQYIVLVVGRKYLPEDAGQPYFAFVEGVTSNQNQLLASLGEHSYSTSTRGHRKLPPARCVGEGKYILLLHDTHTHLCYQLKIPAKTGEVQEDFNLEEKGDYIVNVKNPYQSSPPKVGLEPKQKADYPQKLRSKFKDYRFIPLDPPSFLKYEGAELLLMGKRKADLGEEVPHIEECLSHIPDEEFIERFKKIAAPKPLTPLFEKKWV